MIEPDAPARGPEPAPAAPVPSAPAPAAAVLVDPLRIPGAEPLRRFWANLPEIGQAFLALALVDVVVRTLGVAGLPAPIDLAAPLSALGFVPHLATVLLPVAVLWRRPDAAAEMPLILWGAVALALVELVALPLATLFPFTGGSLAAWTVLQVVAVAVRAGAYLALGLGLIAVTRSTPAPTLQGLSNLVLGVVGGSALTSVLLVLLLPGADLGDPAWNSQIQLVNLLGPLPTLAFAYLGRVVVRGTVDLRRPIAATYTATGAVLMATGMHLAMLVLGLVAIVQLAWALPGGPLGAGASAAFGLLGPAADVLLVVAFALGLADTSVRIPKVGVMDGSEPAQVREQLAWPTPGGEVPAYRPVERPVPKPHRRRGKSKESKA